MRPKEIEKRLKAEIAETTPDLSEKLNRLLDAEPQPLPAAVAVTDTGHRLISRPLWMGTAVLLALMLIALMVWPLLRGGAPSLPSLPDKGFLTLDINPSVQLELDAEGNVRSVVALNDDARVMLAGQTEALVGLPSEQASQRIAAMAMECGYFAPDKKTNAVLLSASYGTVQQADALKQKNKTALTSFFAQEGIYGVVLTQYEGDSLEEEASQYGITAAKLRLIRRAESLGVNIPVEQYADYSIAALYELIEEAAEEADRFGDEQLWAEYEALLEASEENLEEFADLVEDLIEEITEMLEDELEPEEDRRPGNGGMNRNLEHTLELLEETAELLEDARTGGEIETILNRIYDLLDQITGTGVATADEKIALLKEQITAAHQKFLELEQLIEEQLASLEDKRTDLVTQGSSLWEGYQKAEDFEERYEEWLEEAEDLYEREWEKLKEAWEQERD